MGIAPTRAEDERVLSILSILSALRGGGPQRDVAAKHGVPVEYVRTILSRVRRADLAQSGEPEHVVLAGYQ